MKNNINLYMAITVCLLLLLVIVGIKTINSSLNHANLGKTKKHSFGILFASTSNLGDDVQTIAQMQYIPKNVKTIIVNREQMHETTETCDLIMNGWWMHNDKNFPPPKNINPIYISFHIEKPGMVSKKALEHYKKYEPIGCRDIHTMDLLKKHGVKAYFSGCLTLTLKNPFPNPVREKIYIVDAHLPSKVVYPWGADHLLKKLIPQYIQDQAEYIEHEIPDNINMNDMYGRQKFVQQQLLNKYATAKLVITTRLHCALPCVAYNTPVIVLQKNLLTDNRFSGLKQYFHGYSSIDDTVDFDFDNPTPKLSKMQLNKLQSKIRADMNSRLQQIHR